MVDNKDSKKKNTTKKEKKVSKKVKTTVKKKESTEPKKKKITKQKKEANDGSKVVIDNTTENGEILIDEERYSKKLNSLVSKIKSKYFFDCDNSENKIRLGWK